VSNILIGTSGWTYPGWKGKFYPRDLPGRAFLEYYARQFPTAEVNYSFYHLPRVETYEKWAAQVTEGFVFAVKASRFITHIKRLKEVDDAWRLFVENARALAEHWGPILLQFPPSLKCDAELLANFLKMALKGEKRTKKGRLRLAFEFRHETWFTDEIYELMKHDNAALCIADSPDYPRRDLVTADFAYFRYHGREQLFASNYSDAELKKEARLISEIADQGTDVYAYFNNDALGYATSNALHLMKCCQKMRPPA